MTCIDCTEIPTDFAHRDGLIESIGQAICETVEFIPDVLVFRTSRRAADSAVHNGEALNGNAVTTIKRAPTPAERKRFQAALAETNIEQERTFWNPIVDQLRGQADIVSAVDLLKAVRESQGVSLRTLEETAGIARGNISRLANHKNTPDFETLQKYAAALGRTGRGNGTSGTVSPSCRHSVAGKQSVGRLEA